MIDNTFTKTQTSSNACKVPNTSAKMILVWEYTILERALILEDALVKLKSAKVAVIRSLRSYLPSTVKLALTKKTIRFRFQKSRKLTSKR